MSHLSHLWCHNILTFYVNNIKKHTICFIVLYICLAMNPETIFCFIENQQQYLLTFLLLPYKSNSWSLYLSIISQIMSIPGMSQMLSPLLLKRCFNWKINIQTLLIDGLLNWYYFCEKYDRKEFLPHGELKWCSNLTLAFNTMFRLYRMCTLMK